MTGSQGQLKYLRQQPRLYFKKWNRFLIAWWGVWEVWSTEGL